MKYYNIILFSVLLFFSNCEDKKTNNEDVIESTSFLKPGNKKFTYDKYLPLSDMPIQVHTFLPLEEKDNLNLPIIFVLHGHSRNVISNCQDWYVSSREYKFIVVCPEFSPNIFPGSDNYQNGMMWDGAQFSDSLKWTYNLIEEIFSFLKENDVTTIDTYGIYGFSGGGQFVHRYALFTNPKRASLIIPAGSGWYTLPNYSENYPYGLNNSPFIESSLKQKFQLPITIMVGENDIDTNDPDLRKTTQAMRQGVHRYDRAKFFFSAAKNKADDLGAEFNWKLITVSNVGHSANGIAPLAAELFHKSIKN
tara:strand:+ start:2876 stop:3796 length:921 start_codon:yes stop_codon:yes gene_type:complete